MTWKSILSNVFTYVGDTFVLIADCIHKIVSERDLIIDAAAELASVLLYKHIVSGILVKHLDSHQNRPEQRFPEAEISETDEEFAALMRAYRIEPQIKIILNGYKGVSISSDDARSVIESWIEIKNTFCIGRTTVFSNCLTN